MSDFIITRLPTLVNIEGMGIKELRVQYKLLEGDAISQAQQLSDACNSLHRMTKAAMNLDAQLNALADSYDAGDQAAILLMVKNLSERRSAQKAKVH